MLTEHLAVIEAALQYYRDASNHFCEEDCNEYNCEEGANADAALAAVRQEREGGAWEPNERGLLPCPFCGYADNEVSGTQGMYEILCDKCDHISFSYFHSVEMAIEAWNRRAQSPASQQEA